MKRLNKLAQAGAWVMLAAVAPLLLYVVFGPRDGNPIGLGLLFFFGFPVGLVIFIVGMVTGAKS